MTSDVHHTGWQPEEVGWLPAEFEKLESDWQVSTEGALVDLGGEGVLVPDFVFDHGPSGTRGAALVAMRSGQNAMAPRQAATPRRSRSCDMMRPAETVWAALGKAAHRWSVP